MKRLVVLLLALWTARVFAGEPVAQYQLGERGTPHSGVPFTLAMVVEGFDDQPQPDQPKLEIPGAKITAEPLQPPMLSAMIDYNTGRQSKRYTWVFRWQVEVAKAGPIRVPSATATQGNKKATARGADVEVDEIPVADDMKLQLGLPERAVYVGETVPLTLTWLFRRQPHDWHFTLPLANMDDFTVSAPPVTDPRSAIDVTAGGKELKLPFDIDDAEVGGVKYKRVTLRLFAAPRKSGKIDVQPTTAIAALEVGHDVFGMASTRLFRVSDVAHALEVKPLPETDKPANYAGAVGSQFSIAVATSRSVVQLGEPVELAITVKSDQRLDTLALARLDAPGELPKDKFTAPAEPPTGELSADGKSKTFKVTATVTGQATEIPALALAYFDPVKGQYQTIHSDPIALSVKGGSVVGASDVVAAAAPRKPGTSTGAAPEAELALVGADLALSSLGDSEGGGLGGTLVWVLVALLYAMPLGVLGVRTWQTRTREQREEAAEVRAARKKVEHELEHATRAPAREAAGPLTAAIRAYARTLERSASDGGLLARIETESFSPEAAASPLSADVRSDVEKLIRTWATEKKLKSKGAVIMLVLLATAATVHADALSEGRAKYQDAMQLTDASARKQAFARAEVELGEAARGRPNPELLADWGNAALGAGDVATATLAFRRAVALDGSNTRARRNLSWLRSRQSDTLRPAGGSAADTLFFFHQWPRGRRLVVSGIAFAVAVLLLVPWSGRRRRGLTALAVLPLAVWLAMLASLALEDRHTDDAVVMDAAVLRAADSAGAPAALSQPLPRGTEITVVERRDAWTKIRLASGTAGWVPAGAVEQIAR